MKKDIPPQAAPKTNPRPAFAMPEYKSASAMMMEEIKAVMPLIEDTNFRAPRVTYPEERFKKYFAPFFLGVFEVPEGENIQMLWVSEVGSMHTDVDIVDHNGKTLFVVPALMNLEGINLKVTGTSRVRFASINQQYEENSRNFPEKARTDYFRNIGRKLSTAFQDINTDPNHVKKWLAIFTYYNVTPPSSEQYRIVDHGNPTAPGQSHSSAQPPAQDWSNIGRLDFTPTFD